MDTENLLMEVVRMLREREDYYDGECHKANDMGSHSSASVMLSASIAYNSARQMLMAALTDNVEILREYDYYGKKEN